MRRCGAALVLALAVVSAGGCGEGSSGARPRAAGETGAPNRAGDTSAGPPPSAPSSPDPALDQTEAGDPVADAPRSFVGVITPSQAVEIAPAEAGELAAVHVRAGDRVSRGDKIATLDDRPIREALRGARAELRSAQGRLRRAQINRTEARRKLATERELVAAGTSARRAVEDAEVELQRAEADVAAAQFAISEIRVRVDTAERRLKETELVAPFDGTVSVRFREPGSMVGPAKPVARIIATDALWVVFAVPPERRRDVAVGSSVTVAIENVDASLAATVRQVPPELDSASNMFFVEAELEVPDDLEGRIQPRLAARVEPSAQVEPAAGDADP